MLKKMRKLVNSIDLALMAAKAGGDVLLTELVPSPVFNTAVVGTVSNMASGYETGFNPPPEELGMRIQNLVGNLYRGERVPRGMANAVAESKNDPVALFAKLRTLLEQYPALGKYRNVQDYS
ncbi:hypothetical protein [Xanthomonas hortorum]|uniref:Uncharacterized protein n=1 Tax=Xanthomonas hortorum pv. hederae TaxID=453603 RepID=A0A9X3Z111_9XANT|nr:hypothetical protein [Xanthomonas hortorum]MCE4371107.1 hypothetical protein [Xanthomonas hortorum pv. hederae]MDC8638017.1 hypothetical protein [Xanthomonas hortorum pv. hederae]PPU85686.1 hypothetical protein XhhCFBP4925_02570 [Xanthomonas hortorum pv. hederae]PUF00433.1 hypothetical protein C7T87_08210 [Xanthomonas hortorum pv. hederae]